MIYYFSTDKAGNRERLKSETFTVVEPECIGSLRDLINRLYEEGKIKKESVKSILLLKLNIIEKLINKFIDHEYKKCYKNKCCKKLKNKIDHASESIIKATITFIEREFGLYERKKWITSEARVIILDSLQCLNNYLE